MRLKETIVSLNLNVVASFCGRLDNDLFVLLESSIENDTTTLSEKKQGELTGTDPEFQVMEAHSKKLRRAQGGA
jgi:hypothetical protein